MSEFPAVPRSPTSCPRASEVPQAKTSPFAHDGPPEDFGKDQLVFVRMPRGLKVRRHVAVEATSMDRHAVQLLDFLAGPNYS